MLSSIYQWKHPTVEILRDNFFFFSAMSGFGGRLASWFANEIATKFLAKNPAFLRAAAKTHEKVTKIQPSTMLRVVRRPSVSCELPSLSCLAVNTVPVPSLAPGFAIIQVSGSAINHDDLANQFENISLGFDGAGLVQAVGESCDGLAVGDPVWTTFPLKVTDFEDPTSWEQQGSGGLAEYALVKCDLTRPAPHSASLADAGTFPANALTSLGALQSAGITTGSIVLITTGTGGTGYSGVQLAKALGASKVITAAGHDDGVSFVRSLGADVVVDYHKSSVFDAVPDGSVDIVYDNIGIGDLTVGLKKLKSPGGVFVSIVDASIGPHPAGVKVMFYNVWSQEELLTYPAKMDALAAFIDSKAIRVLVNQTYDFEHVKVAYMQFDHGGFMSRIGVTPHAEAGIKGGGGILRDGVRDILAV